MKKNLLNIVLSFLATSIFSILVYYISTIYDKSGNIIIRINSNLYYLSFLFLSITISLSLYLSKTKKSKLLLYTIILINFLYITFLFGVSQIGLNHNQGLFLIGFLVLALTSNYVKNTLGVVFSSISVFGIIITLGFAIIPIYEKGPDVAGFQKQFKTQIITYSKVNLNKTNAYIQLDNKIFNIPKGLSTHNLNTKQSGSNLLFVSNKKYLNTFGYILFSNKNIIQIYPQSAIKIQKQEQKYQLEIITGIIKKYTKQDNTKIYIFTGKNIPSKIIDSNKIQDINKFYDQQLKDYILKQIGKNKIENKNIRTLSRLVLNLLYKTFPGQYKNNLKNFNDFQKYLDTDQTGGTNQTLTKFNIQKIKHGFLKKIKDALEANKIIK